jgi:transposase-like protein
MGCHRINSQPNSWSLFIYVSRHRNMIVVEAFLSSLIRVYGKHTVYSDGDGTWYPEACVSLGLKHRLHSSYEKSIVVERTIKYLKDRTKDLTTTTIFHV